MEKLSTKRKLLLTSERIADLLEKLVDQKTLLATVDDDALEHVTVEWIADFLGIHKSNFYRNVNHKLVKPVCYVGRRPYYLKRDIQQLLFPHEKGAHTYSKISKPSSSDLPNP